jgi:hypothetical protein
MNQLFGFGLRGYVSGVVIHLVSFSPASVEIGNKGRDGQPGHGILQTLEGCQMVSGADYAIALTGNHHFWPFEELRYTRWRTCDLPKERAQPRLADRVQ